MAYINASVRNFQMNYVSQAYLRNSGKRSWRVPVTDGSAQRVASERSYLPGTVNPPSNSPMAPGSAVTSSILAGSTAEEASGIQDAYPFNTTVSQEATSRELKMMGIVECETCESRRYQDGSNDPGVSFKSPTSISPESAPAMVMAHEREHVGHEQARAEQEGREVVSQTVRIFTDVCPECGRVYVSGGQTTTVTMGESRSRNDAGNVIKELMNKGNNVDVNT